jgi:hypothetical protein
MLVANGNFSFVRLVPSVTHITDNSNEAKGQIAQDVSVLKMCYSLMKKKTASAAPVC